MVKGKKEMTNIKDVQQKSNTSLNDLSTKLREHGRLTMLSFLSSLPIQVLCILDIEANSDVLLDGAQMLRYMRVHFCTCSKLRISLTRMKDYPIFYNG